LINTVIFSLLKQKYKMKNNKVITILLGILILAISSCQKEEQAAISKKMDNLNKNKVKFKKNGLKDIDGNKYAEVTIGTQVWMAENLKVSTFRNGDPIPNVTDATQWAALTTPAWCNLLNDPLNDQIYGKIYNGYTMLDPRGLAPEGWHVPSLSEWQILIDYLGGNAVAGGKMKATGTIESGTGSWYAPNAGADNSSGFSALGSGRGRSSGPGGGNFFEILPPIGVGYCTWFWTTNAVFLPDFGYATKIELYNSTEAATSYFLAIASGCYIRCIKD
jgi:uncharacterized protein (TIGR02145 family)